MEDRLRKLKSVILKGELSGFEFSTEMKKNVVDRLGNKPKAFRFRGLVPAGLSAAFLVVFSLGIYWLVDSYYSDNLGDTPPVKEEVPVVESLDDDEPKVVEFDEAMATALLDRYQDTLEMVYADTAQPDFRFKSYSDVNEIYDLFSDFMERDMVEKIYSGRIDEKQDGLYYLPTEGAPNYRKGSPFTLDKITDTEYVLTQLQEFDDAYDRKFIAKYKYDAGRWKVDSLHTIEVFEDKLAVYLLKLYDNTLSKYHKSKEDFYRELKYFMSDEYINQLNLPLGENDQGVYLQGTDTFIRFWEETPYHFEKVSEDEFKLTQIQESDLHGVGKFTAIFKVLDYSWKIASLEIEELPTPPLEEKQAIELLERYTNTKDTAFEDGLENPDYKFSSYKTKEEFYAVFTPFMAYELVEATYNYRITQKEDGLYIEAMDSPHTYWPDTPYDFVKESDRMYKLIQLQESDMNGKEKFIVTFHRYEGNWIIADITIEQY